MVEQGTNWRQEVQSRILKFGTTEPVTLADFQISLYSYTGRAIVDDDFNPANVPTRYEVWRHDGGRVGKKADFAAYTEVLQNYGDSLGLVSLLRDNIYSYKFKTTVDGILTVLHGIHGLPYWLVHRSDDPIENGQLPPFITNAARIVRGIISPYEEYQRNQISPTKLTYELPTADEVTSSSGFVNYVMRSGILVSDEDDSIACPVTRAKLGNFMDVLLKEPHPDQDLARKIAAPLGITPKTMSRIKKFGVAMAASRNATLDFESIIKTEPEYPSLLLRERPVMVVFEGHDRAIDVVERYLNKKNKAQDAMNQSLRRKKTRPLTRADVANRVKLLR